MKPTYDSITDCTVKLEFDLDLVFGASPYFTLQITKVCCTSKPHPLFNSWPDPLLIPRFFFMTQLKMTKKRFVTK